MRIAGRALLCLLAVVVQAPASAAIACKEISGFDRISSASGVFVGDMHGTVEAPDFAKSLVCRLLRSGRAVVLALEYPSDEQHFLDEFLQAHSGQPQLALLASPFWTRPTQDGRTSRAMFDLLDGIRQQAARGARVRVVAFDSLPTSQLSGAAAFDARDAAMAARLREELARLAPDEFPIIFTGNVHARKTRGLQAVNAPPGMENAEPLGYRLRDLGFLSMNIGYHGGSAWTCPSPSSCGVIDLGKSRRTVSRYSIVPSEDPAYDLTYLVGPLTASPPAAAVRVALASYGTADGLAGERQPIRV